MKVEKFANLVNKAKNNSEAVMEILKNYETDNKQICKENLFYG